MKPACMTVLISIASCVCLSFCYPSKPLNERSTELAWEAWLLVDQSNRQSDLGLLRRRITPKSVFIAPTFSPDSLPACAEGYKSDMMGRCVKIIKINESVHFDFLLQKLNAQFPDYEEVFEDNSTHGPLQLNIPLLGDEEKDSDVAIVVTPSKKSHHETTTSVKVDVKRNGSDKFGVEDVAAILGVKPEEVEMTTIADFATTIMESTTFEATTETTTESSTPTTTTGSGEETTTLLEGEALFWRRI
ncbi:uncharacterized protein LOC123003924 [Tribolium madens]|uniref:uncharacterized protein LOC123003924 n=1 Tax=Tribolium madens TaxID=41895 RepID=UPI001CF75469|nr:uncharacterized protein LOC123003924 [Tribolium madens]